MESVTAAPSVQTTIRVPSALYERARQLVERGAAQSLNEFIIGAMESRINQLRPRGFAERSCTADDSCFDHLGVRQESERCDFDVFEEFGE